jgi:hypothetical protein
VVLCSWKKMAAELEGVGVGVDELAGTTVEIESPIRT